MNCKHLFWNLKKSELDLVNILINIIERNDGYDTEHDFDYNTPFYLVDTNLHELAAALGYVELNDKIIQEITSLLDNVSCKQATIHYESTGNERHIEKSIFIQKYMLSSYKREIDKRIYIYLSTSIIKVLREDTSLFEKLYNYDRYDLRSKYSMILYDELKSRSKSSTNTMATVFTLDEFTKLIDFDLTTTNNTESWTKINGNILSRAEKELNDKTNMYFSYSKVKEKVSETDRTQTNAIRFETSVAPELEATPTYFTQEEILERKITYYMEREINRKLTTLKRMGTVKIDDVENYKHSERKKLQKEKPEYEAEVKLQDWVNWVKMINYGEHGLVILADYQGREGVTINNDYKIFDVSTKEILSTSARDTQIKMNAFLANGGDFGIADVDYDKSFSISYSKG